MKRIPRKLKKRIPVGFYCYAQTSGFKDFGNGLWGCKIKPCHFYQHVYGIEGKCKLLNCETLDQIKSCGLKYGKIK